MSASGVNNIMAYSWPSHCKRYLETIEYQKRYIKKHKVRAIASGMFCICASNLVEHLLRL